MNKATLSMAMHCFQPVFNPEGEMEYAYHHAYLPFIETLEEFPRIKATLHFSGNMIEWFEEKHPEYITLVKRLLERGQVELIGGGYFEPVMALIPERDRKEQLKMSSDIIQKTFGVKAQGAWMTERVWLPELAETLSSRGIKYTILDDYHFTSSGIEKENIYRPYCLQAAEEEVILFPSLTKLRHMIPFFSVRKVMDYMKGISLEKDSEKVNFFFADDMEKFGVWPHTYKHVYKRRWIKKFFSALEDSSDWITTCTFSEAARSLEPVRVKNLPEGAYPEMDEWSGGSFKNFLDKYPEARRMHSRMISVSDRIDLYKKDLSQEDSEKAKRELFKAQTSCPYWHGTFGGVYLPHLREGVYRHLLNAERKLDEVHSRTKSKVTAAQVDLSSEREETVLDNSEIKIFTSSVGGKLTELDWKKKGINLINTMTRKKEKYHRKLDKGYSYDMKKARKAFLRGDFADVHDLLGVKEKGLERSLSYDTYERGSFLTHILQKENKKLSISDFTGKSLVNGAFSSRLETEGDTISLLLSASEEIDGRSLEVKKNITLREGKAINFTHEIINCSREKNEFSYALEFNFLIRDYEELKGKTDHLTLKDRFSDMEVHFFMDRPYRIIKYPIYSINETEEGLARTFQGVCVLIGSECTSKKDEMNLLVALR